MKKTILYLCIICSVLFSCNFAGDAKWAEIERIPSPDNKVEAVLVSSDAGATTSTGFHVFIVPKGSKIETGYEKFIADKVLGIKLSWKKNKLLEIQYESARIFKFSNFWNSQSLQNWNYIVEIKLSPVNEDFSLPELYR